MNHQKEMIEELLKSLSIIEMSSVHDPSVPMARLFGAGERRQQLLSWIARVTSSLEAADMTKELRIWKQTVKYGVPVSSESSLAAQTASLRAVLVGFLEKFDRDGPSDALFPIELVEGTRDYIEKVAEQVNGCYQRGWYDACVVMLRRLIETLIIECFEHYNIAAKIKDKDGNYFYLRDLINSFLSETAWHIPRNTDKNLLRLKTIGDASAHSRYFTAKRSDIEQLSEAIRFTIQTLVYIAGFQ